VHPKCVNLCGLDFWQVIGSLEKLFNI
jgi:hypothetical protein